MGKSYPLRGLHISVTFSSSERLFRTKIIYLFIYYTLPSQNLLS